MTACTVSPKFQVVIPREVRQGRVVSIDEGLALAAAKLSLAHQLPMADSLILAAARAHGALLWTGDAHFEGLEGVRYVAR